MTAIRKYLEEYKDEMIELLGELVAIPSIMGCLLYTSPSPRDPKTSRMPSSA